MGIYNIYLKVNNVISIGKTLIFDFLIFLFIKHIFIIYSLLIYKKYFENSMINNLKKNKYYSVLQKLFTL